MLLINQGADYTWFAIIIILILLSPAIILTIIGAILMKNHRPKSGKVLFIIAGAYIIIGLGICGSMMM